MSFHLYDVAQLSKAGFAQQWRYKGESKRSITVSEMYAIKARGECTMSSFRMVYHTSVSLSYVISIPGLTLQAANAIMIVKGFQKDSENDWGCMQCSESKCMKRNKVVVDVEEER
jgi:hypothetical protein